MLKGLFSIIITLLLFCGSSSGGQLSDDLAEKISGYSSDDRIPVLIGLDQRVAGLAFKTQLNKDYKTHADRHRHGMMELKNIAADSQNELLLELRQLENDNLVSNIKSHWIINVIEVEITVSEIERIADRTDVEYVFQMPKIELIESPDYYTAKSSDITADIQPNIEVIGADSAWALGYDGQGRIVCSFDTGVEGIHPALYDKWKGHDGNTDAAWFDPIGNASFPYDHSDHGTRSMGIMVGQDTLTGDFIGGVAPGAKWITAAVLDIPGASMIDAFEWAVDPDGDPNTINDVPDVINHSWGVKGIDCHDYYWEMIDNTEALGIINIFACGNEGRQGDMTLRNPANRAFDSLDCFAVGATDKNGTAIASYSSRGPSDCDTISIKPNVVAPGSKIWTPTGSALYSDVFGTSFAAPHVSGAVAILRQYAPNATPDEIKEALIAGCRRMPDSTSEPNNTYGWGLINIPASLEALSPELKPNIRVYSFEHSLVNPGDVVSGFITIKNFGSEVDSVYAIHSGANGGVDDVTDSLYFGWLGSDDTAVSHIQFSAEISDTILPGTILTVYYEMFGAGNFNRMCKIYIKVGENPLPEFFTHSNDMLRFTISNFGEYGFAGGSFYPLGYDGFRYDDLNRNDLYEGALLIGVDENHVSDGARNLVEEPDNDFAVSADGELEIYVPGIKADQETFSIFNDSRAENPIGLEISQRTFSWNEFPYDNFVIMEYVITNTTESVIENMYAGLFFDWDLIPFWSNDAGYVEEEDLGYMFYPEDITIINNEGHLDTIIIPGLYRGTAVLNSEGMHSHKYGVRPGSGPYDYMEESYKYATLSGGELTEYPYWGGADLSHITSTGPFTIPPGGSDSAVFAIVAGGVLADITEAAAFARSRYGAVTDVEMTSETVLPGKFYLSQNYPNPFNPSTTVSFAINARSRVNLAIYNLLGERVIELIDKDLPAGVYKVTWDGQNSSGKRVASGIYFYRMTAGDETMTRKMLLLK